jgi:hypothetical protein
MTFKSYYDKLDDDGKADIRKKVMSKTGCSQATFYYWISPRFKNNMNRLFRKEISTITGIPVEELFVETENKKTA